jgi:DNA-binding transcriptional regulator PaaX
VKVVTRSGHGGHVIVPENWIGKTVRVVPIDNVSNVADQANTKQGRKYLDKVSKEVGENLSKTRSKSKN